MTLLNDDKLGGDSSSKDNRKYNIFVVALYMHMYKHRYGYIYLHTFQQSADRAKTTKPT